MRRLNPTLLAVASLALAALGACSEPSDAGTPAPRQDAAQQVPPLRIVRVAPVQEGPSYVEQLEAQVSGCRLKNGLPPAAFTPPALTGVHLIEVEELFDGPRHALYETRAVVAPDAGRGCALMLWMQRSVLIETSCGPRSRGMSTPIDALLFERHPPAVTWEQDPADNSGCDVRQPPEPATAAPREPLPGGSACVWSSAMTALAADARAAVAPGPSPGAADVCLHARWPVHSHSDASGRPLSIELRSHSPRTLPAMQSLGVAADALAQNLSSLTEGQPIPAARFTQAGAMVFLNQPHQRSLGPAKP